MNLLTLLPSSFASSFNFSISAGCPDTLIGALTNLYKTVTDAERTSNGEGYISISGQGNYKTIVVNILDTSALYTISAPFLFGGSWFVRLYNTNGTVLANTTVKINFTGFY